ncbi:LOW QUALITY PROTEIN: fibronectin type 3 and ankyrin repeat domains 1 protein-like [Diretmus argenteus]
MTFPAGESVYITPVSASTISGFIQHCPTREVKELLSGENLHQAVNVNEEEEVNKALQSGHYGATQSRDIGGCTPLHWAVDGGHLAVIAYMIQDGCELDVRVNVSHQTPLMKVSAVSRAPAVASLIIRAGADVNTRDKDGKTPLSVAVLNNHEEPVQLLLDGGADPHVKNEV